MKHLYNCRACGGPVFGTWLYSEHHCKPTPYVIIYQSPQDSVPPKPTEPTAEHDRITPGEATRLCHKIAEQIAEHCTSCEYCKLVLKLQLRIRLCDDALALQKALEQWEQYTLIEVDKR